MYLLAHSQAGLPLPEKAPTIHFTSQEHIRTLLGCVRCRPSGAQIREDVYVDEALDFSHAYEASILLHELVHYLQQGHIKFAHLSGCQRERAKEQEAYAIQNAYLAALHSEQRVTFYGGEFDCAAEASPPAK